MVTVTQESGEKIRFHVDKSAEIHDENDEVKYVIETSEFPEQSFYKNGPQDTWSDASAHKFTMRLKALTLPTEPVPVSSVSFKQDALKIIASDEEQIEVAFTPANATDYGLTWTSSDSNIAEVNASGMVKAVSPGNCVVTAASANGKSASCTVNVWKLEKVTGLTLEKATTSSIQLKWDKLNEASGYQLQRYNSEKRKWQVLCYLDGKDCNSYTDKKLKGGTYYYVVRAYVKKNNKRIYGDYSDKFKAKTADIKPKIPVLSKVSNTRHGILVKWEKVSEADGYNVYRKAKNGTWEKISTIQKSSDTSFTDKSVKNKNGTLYHYTVEAYRGSAASGYHTTGKKMVRLLAPVLSKPVCKYSKAMAVKWSKNKKASGYQIQYALKHNFQNAKSVNIKSGKTAARTLKNLQKNKTYYVRMRSCKKVGGKKYYSAWSSVKSVKIK